MVVDLRVKVKVSHSPISVHFSANKIKQGWSKIVDKMKSKKAKKKKMKRMEEELVMRIMALQENEDDVSSREGSIHSLQDSERVSPPCVYPKRTESDRFAATYLRCKSTGGQRSGELHEKRPGGHDGIQAVL